MIGLGIVIGLCAAAPACLVPPFSTLQDAKLVGPGKVEVTPFYSSIGASSEGETKHMQDDFGVQAEAGIFRWLDVGFRYEYLRHLDSGDRYDDSFDAHIVAAGPKFSLVKNRLSVALPVGFAFGVGVTWEFQPTILFTLPVGSVVDINVSAKALIPVQSEGNTLYAVNFGLGIKPGEKALTLRPEAGLLFDTEGEGFYFHLSLGLSFRFGK
jgi:hypothetical protein